MAEVASPLLATKLFIPPARPSLVSRPRLLERLGKALGQGSVLVSAPAGFGKTTLVSEWVSSCGRPAAWLSLDRGDNDPATFLAYLVSALRTIMPGVGEGILNALHTYQSQSPPTESLLAMLLNDLTNISEDLILVLDDYHVIEDQSLNHAVTLLVEHLPPRMHLVIVSREDPSFPLALYRARGQLVELRATDLRFTAAEAAEFLNQIMGLNLSAEDIAALDSRTEGWIAGLQLAAISMQGHQDASSFIKSFTGSHHFVLDYLVEEVLQKQSNSVQTFLVRTSILDRLCGPLCDAVLLDQSVSGQETLEYLEHANLFIVPLDEERRWYRYHRLFADLLRQRLRQSTTSTTEDKGIDVAELHKRASAWYEDNGLELEAFRHAAAAHDVERAERLIDGKGLYQHYSRRAVVLDWLASLPTTVLDARPSLWVRYASAILGGGQTTGVEEKLRAAEAALQGAALDDETRDLIGQIAAARATLALTRYQPEVMITQGRRALEYLRPDNLTSRFMANWNIAFAYRFRGERSAAGRAFTEALSIAQESGNSRNTSLATICLGEMQESENQLYLAAENYRRALQLLGDQPPPSASEAHLGLARIFYEWNDLRAAEQQGQESLQLARLYDKKIDRFILGEVFLARLKLARGDAASAANMLSQTEQTARQNNFTLRLPEIAAAQVRVLLKQANLPAATELVQRFELPLSQARVLLAQGNFATALAVLASFRQQMEARGWADERLRAMVLQAVAFHLKGEKNLAAQVLTEALALAEPGGFIRLFVDEAIAMANLLSEARNRGIMPGYVVRLLAAFGVEDQKGGGEFPHPVAMPFGEPLSQRELDVLRLMAKGLSNREIGERLFLALDTIKGHNRIIFGKLQVQRRTEAVARAREFGLL